VIRGVFNDSEARVPLVVRGLDGREQGVAAVLDTGFTGFLTLPFSVVEDLDLMWRGRSQAVVGDGTLHVFDVFYAVVLWGDEERLVEVAATETEPLLGVAMLYDHELSIRFVEDGMVTIDKFSDSRP